MTRYLVHSKTMIRVNVHDAKTHLSRYLKQVQAGETVLVCIRNRPVAELRAVQPERRTPRPIGLESDHLSVPDAFFDPLPDSVLDGFEGAAP